MRIFVLFLLITILNIQNMYADAIYTTNVLNGCVYSTNINALFESNVYTCSVGYYLPANYDGCVICPSGATCNGGTYSFNENISQGIIYPEQIIMNIYHGCDVGLSGELTALFEPNSHNCSVGYYLPANTDGCVICPANSYCVGGTYTFNETVAQGITSCGAGLYSPAGMWEAAQCGRILHIGDEVVYLRSVKKTTPSLHIDINSDGVADYFGNMTTLDVPMTNGTERKLKISFGGQTYSVYDDSVDLTQYQNEL